MCDSLKFACEYDKLACYHTNFACDCVISRVIAWMSRVLHSFCSVFIYRLLVLIEFLTKWPIICLALGISPSLTAFLMSPLSCSSLLKLNFLLAFFASAIPVETKQANEIQNVNLIFSVLHLCACTDILFQYWPRNSGPYSNFKNTRLRQAYMRIQSSSVSINI